jgi:hypothetical protein
MDPNEKEKSFVAVATKLFSFRSLVFLGEIT